MADGTYQKQDVYLETLLSQVVLGTDADGKIIDGTTAGDARYLLLDQTTAQTVTASPIFDWGTSTRIPFYDASKKLTSHANLTFSTGDTTLNTGSVAVQARVTFLNGSSFTDSTPNIHRLTNDLHINGGTFGKILFRSGGYDVGKFLLDGKFGIMCTPISNLSIDGDIHLGAYNSDIHALWMGKTSVSSLSDATLYNDTGNVSLNAGASKHLYLKINNSSVVDVSTGSLSVAGGVYAYALNINDQDGTTPMVYLNGYSLATAPFIHFEGVASDSSLATNMATNVSFTYTTYVKVKLSDGSGTFDGWIAVYHNDSGGSGGSS